ncbi:hypothetical protein JCM3770_006879 [Rhodotorula araucariae]
MLRRLLLPLVVAAALCDATKVLLPLYQYSEDCWPELQTAASQNPSLEFLLILNPDSGPVGDASNPSLACVPKLRALLPGSTLTGYVRTGYGKRSAADVAQEVEAYKRWSEIEVAGGKTAALDGIFFDEVDDSAKEKNLQLHQKHADAAREAFGADGIIIFNPGTAVDAAFYKMADIVVAYESAYADYSESSLPPSALLPQAAIMLHNFTPSSYTSTVASLVPAVNALFITDVKIDSQDIYETWGGGWYDFCKAVAQANGAASTGSSGTTTTRRATASGQSSVTAASSESTAGHPSRPAATGSTGRSGGPVENENGSTSGAGLRVQPWGLLRWF